MVVLQKDGFEDVDIDIEPLQTQNLGSGSRPSKALARNGRGRQAANTCSQGASQLNSCQELDA